MGYATENAAWLDQKQREILDDGWANYGLVMSVECTLVMIRQVRPDWQRASIAPRMHFVDARGTGLSHIRSGSRRATAV